MRKLLLAPIIISAFLFSYRETFATHAAGMDLTYECLGNGYYHFTATFYRECGGIDAPFALPLAITSTCGYNENFVMNLSFSTQGSDSISHLAGLCPQFSSECVNGLEVGYEQYIYEVTVQLLQPCSDYTCAIFENARNSAITNLENADQYALYTEAHLNNTNNLCNNSPVFTTIPLSYGCINQYWSYNHGAFDTDGDSLAYELVNPLDGPPAIDIPYAFGNGFSPTYPFSTTTATFDFSAQTGQMGGIPDGGQIVVISVLVKEYRNGNQIGSTQRDLQAVFDECSNIVPSIPVGITNVIAGTQVDNFTMIICPGEYVEFDFQGLDPDAGQELTLNTNLAQAIPGANFTWTGINPVTGTFDWQTSVNDSGYYSFTVTISDDGCPLVGQQIYSFTIQVIIPPVYAGVDTTICASDAVVQLHIDGEPPFLWTDAQYLDDATSQNPIATLPAPGTYVFVAAGHSGEPCEAKDSIVITVIPGPDATAAATFDTLCLGEQVDLSALGSGGSGNYSYSWTSIPAGFNSGQQDTTDIPSSTTTYVIEVDDGQCKGYDTITVEVQIPVVVQASPDTTICESDPVVTLHANAALPVLWSNGQYLDDETSLDPVATLPGAGTFIFIATGDVNGFCEDKDTLTVIVDPEVFADAIISDDTICQGDTISMNSMGSGGSGTFGYSWSSFPIGLIDSLHNSSDSPDSSTIYIIEISSGVCKAYDTVSVEVQIPVDVIATPDTTICASDPVVQLHATGVLPILWSNDQYLDNGTIADPIASFPGPGTYEFVVIGDYNGYCERNDTLTIVVDPEVQVQASASADTICEGEQISLISISNGGLGNYSYSWTSDPPGFNSSSQDTTDVPAGGTISYYIETGSGACKAYDTVSVNVHVPVDVVAGPDTLLCESNAIVQLYTTGDAPILWDNDQYLDNGTIANPVASFPGPGTYTFIVTGDIGGYCERKDTITIVVTPVVETNIFSLPNDTICAGQPVDLSAGILGGTGTNDFSWSSNPAGFIDSFQNVIDNPDSTTEYYVQVISGGCMAFDTFKLHVVPFIPTIATPDTVFCNPDNSIQLNVTGAAPFLWSNSQYLNDSTISNPIATFPGPGTYFFTVVADVGGFCENTDTISVTLSIAPSVVAASSDDTICFGETVDLFSAASGGVGTYNYLWVSDPPGFSNNSANTIDAPEVNTVYYMEVTSGSCYAYDTVNVAVIPLPDPAFSVLPLALCANEPATINYTGTSTGVSFTWDFGSGTVQSGSGSGPYIVSWSNGANQTVTLTVTDTFGCDATSTVNVLVHPLPVASFNSIVAGCEPLTVFFENTSTDGDTYFWDLDDNTTSTDQNPSHIYSTGSYDVSLIVSSVNGCKDTVSIADYIQVVPAAIADFVINEPYNIEIDASQAYYSFSNFSQNATTYFWDFGDGTSSTDENPSHHYTQTDTFYVTLTACNDYCCDTMIVGKIIVVSYDELFFPSAFSPNGDGVNEFFHELGQDGIVSLYYAIYNRWGQLIFETSEIDGAWDGTYEGEQQELAVYVWSAKAQMINGLNLEVKGNVTLVR